MSGGILPADMTLAELDNPGVLSRNAMKNRETLMGILAGLKAPIDQWGRYARGEDPVMDPITGHVATGVIENAFDMGGYAMTGGFGGAPKGAIGSGPIRAYHGSPHDFDRFSLDKIGTGEGAQAYGHGLYFAEKEGVAKSYRDNLQPEPRWFDGDRELKSYEAVAADAILQEGGRENALKWIKRVGGSAGADKEYVSKVEAALRSLDPAKIKKQDAPPGRMYEVQINADPDRFLDWDKPLSEHPREVRDALAKTAWADQGATADDLLGVGLPGEHAYKRMISQRGGSNLDGGVRVPQATDATEALRQAGIPGIKYLDQGSRTAGDGSRNYVVFDDSLVEIVKKYGIAGLALLPPAVLMANGIDPASVGQEQ
jgi:hypothetical protein